MGMNGFGGTEAQIGFNAGDGVNFASHPYSQTPAVINITRSRVPEAVTRDGMLMYRVDGTIIGMCRDDETGQYVTNLHTSAIS